MNPIRETAAAANRQGGAGENAAFLDCFSGVSGDMWVGALLDLGLPLDELVGPVASLGLPGVSLHAETVRRQSLVGTQFEVRVAGKAATERHLADILAIVAAADLPDPVRQRVESVFRTLGEVEASVHGVSIDEVHFHEVGAEDTIVDVVCAVLGSYLLGFDRIYSSAVVTGSGLVQCAHGEMPVPAPGALGNLIGIPIRRGKSPGECVTPTGAALLKVLVDEFEPDLTFTPRAVGYGAGTRDDPARPNLLRVTAGTMVTDDGPDGLSEVSCNLDTVTGEGLAYLIQGAMARGAVDAFATAIQMKKGRPGHVLSALVDDAHRAAVVEFLLEESSSLGVRMHRVSRAVLERWEESRETEFGTVRFKLARLPSGNLVCRPEDAEVIRIAEEQGIGRREVLRRLQR